MSCSIWAFQAFGEGLLYTQVQLLNNIGKRANELSVHRKLWNRVSTEQHFVSRGAFGGDIRLAQLVRGDASPVQVAGSI